MTAYVNAPSGSGGIFSATAESAAANTAASIRMFFIG